jgi:hypothetical protein
MADLNSVAPMLKEVWPDSFNTAFSNEIVGLQRIEQTSRGVSHDVSGRYVVIPLKVRRNQGIGSRPERGILPLPGKQGFVGTRVTLRHQYGVFDITAQALKLADREPRSFINALDQEMSGLREDVMKDYARQFYGQADGILATVESVAGNVVTVDRIQYMDVEMRLDSVDTAGPTLGADGAEVLDVDEGDRTITLSDATGVAAGHVLVRTGNYGQEINGLGALIDDEIPVQNLDPAEEPKWAASVISGDDRAWSEMEQVAAFQNVRRRTGKMPTVMFTGFGVERAIFGQLSSSREFVNTIEFGHGYSALPFNIGSTTIPLVADPDYPEDIDAETSSILGVREDDVQVYREEEGWHFADETGSIFLAAQDRSDAWEARMRQFSQLGTRQRNSHFKIDGIQTVTGQPAAAG